MDETLGKIKLNNITWKFLAGTTLVGDLITLTDQLSVTLVLSPLSPDIEQFDLAHILSSPSEQTEASQENVCVSGEPHRLNAVAAVAPATAVRVEPVDDGEILFRVRLSGAEPRVLLLAVGECGGAAGDGVQAGEQVEGGLGPGHETAGSDG